MTVDIPKEGATYKAKITAIEVVRAGDLFGEKAKEPDRETLRVTFEGPDAVSGNAALSAPGISGGKVMVRNPKSNLFKFAKKYGAGPKKGMAIEVRMDADGFFRLVLE